jgi:hypothetical protein
VSRARVLGPSRRSAQGDPSVGRRRSSARPGNVLVGRFRFRPHVPSGNPPECPPAASGPLAWCLSAAEGRGLKKRLDNRLAPSSRPQAFVRSAGVYQQIRSARDPTRPGSFGLRGAGAGCGSGVRGTVTVLRQAPDVARVHGQQPPVLPRGEGVADSDPDPRPG